MRPGDTLARVAGDEFVFLCEDLTGPGDADVLGGRIDDAFATPFVLTDVQLTVNASVGIAVALPGEDISKQLILDADAAMYQVKRRGGGSHQVIGPNEAGDARARNQLERDLRAGLVAGELDVAYQPVVRIRDGSVAGVEALLRWTHHDQGVVPAPMAVAVAEQSGLILEIGAWVLERSCRGSTPRRPRGRTDPVPRNRSVRPAGTRGR